ncbi:MAG: hypothetical protein ACFFDT_26480, partial [Candidatus Hodarchaeota archaeon]
VIIEVLYGVRKYFLNYLIEQNVEQYVESNLSTLEQAQYLIKYSVISSILLMLGLIILIFPIIYHMGKNHNIAMNLRLTTLWVLFSSYFGSLTGKIAMYLSLTPPDSLRKELLLLIISPAGLYIFFMAFTALSLAYLRYIHPVSRTTTYQPDHIKDQTTLTMKQLLTGIIFISACVGILDGGRQFLLPIVLTMLTVSSGSSSPSYGINYSFIYISISWIIIYLLILGVYRVGKNFKFDTSLRQTIIYILGGAYLGRWLGTFVVIIPIRFIGTSANSLFYWLGVFLVTTASLSAFELPHMFFMIFT